MPINKKLQLESLESRQLLAVDFTLLQDIETKPGKSSEFAVLGAVGEEVAFAFTAQDSLRFRDQLWQKPAGGSGPAHPLHDAGNLSTVSTDRVIELNGRYLFNRSSNLPEEDGLWSTDGTAAGSFRLGPSSSNTPKIAAGVAYFFVHRHEGRSLWATDGTVAGTRMLALNRDEQNFHFDSPLASDGNRVYLVVQDHSSIRHIATIDSSEKISPLVQFPPGEIGQLEFVGNGRLLATNRPGLIGPYNEVYSYTTDQGLILISDEVRGIPNLPTLHLFGDIALFTGDSFSTWRTDGTIEGTLRILDGSYRLADRPAIAAIGNRYLFAAGTDYFYSDGTDGGTIALGVNVPVHPYYFSIASSTDAFYFIGINELNQFQLYRVEASSGELQVITSISNPGLSALPEQGQLFFNFPTVVDDRVFFIDDQILYEYLPHQEKTVRVSPELGTAGKWPEFFAQSNQYAWFKIDHDIWQTNGSAAQTRQVLFHSDALKPSFFYQPQIINEQLVFEGLANTFPGPSEYGRWSVDSQTGEATRLNLSSSIAQSKIADLPRGMFQIRRDDAGSGVYQISADLKTEQLIATIPSISVDDDVELTRLGNRLVFITKAELWQTDGTAHGTFRVNTTSDPDAFVSELHLDNDGNLLFLTVSRQIYRMDKDGALAIHLGTLTENGVWNGAFLPSGDGIVFVGNKPGDSFKEKNLWYSNGSETRLLRDFTNGEEDVSPVLLGMAEDIVIVASGNPRLGYSLWATDGTAEKTVRILHSPRGQAWPTWHTASQTPDGRLLITFFDEQFGREIWITDGTANGTELFSDIATGANNSNPRFRFFGDNILAFASTTAHGAQEPFVADFNQFISAQPTDAFRSIVEENHAGAFVGSIKLADIPSSDILGFQLHDINEVDRYLIDLVTGDLRLQPTFAFDFEAEPSASVDIDVRFRDTVRNEVLTRKIAVKIQVVNRIEAPVIHDQVFEADENLDSGKFIGKIVVSNERDSEIKFSLTGGSPFNVNPNSGQIYVPYSINLDYELRSEMSFVVKVFDNHNFTSATATIRVQLRNIDEPPVLSQQLAPVPRTIFSGAETVIQFAAAIFVDPEGQPVTYRVTMPDGSGLPSWQTFDGNTRSLISTPTQNSIGVHAYRLVATDISGNESSVAFQLTVLDGQYPWHNSISPLDINRDGRISPIDALLVINRLNEITSRILPSTNHLASVFYDTNRNGWVSPADALLIINWMNNGSSGEGEQAAYIADFVFDDNDDFGVWYDPSIDSALVQELKRLRKGV